MGIDTNKLIAMGISSTPTYLEALEARDIIVHSVGGVANITTWNHPDAQPSDSAINAFDDLTYYKTKAKTKLRKEGREHALSIWSQEEQSNVNGGIESGNTTKARKNTFINAMKTEWGVVKTAINAASNELEVDAVTASWPTTPAP